MQVGQYIEYIREKQNIPVFQMCNILMLVSELEYDDIKKGRIKPTVLQSIMFVAATRCPIDL